MWNVIGVHKALQSKQDWNTHRNTGSKLAGSTYKGFSLTEPFQIHRKRLELALIEASLKNCNSEKELHLYAILNSNHSSWPLLLATLAHTATQPLFPPSTQVAAGDSSTGREQTQCSQPSALLLGFYCSPKGCAASCTARTLKLFLFFPWQMRRTAVPLSVQTRRSALLRGAAAGPCLGFAAEAPTESCAVGYAMGACNMASTVTHRGVWAAFSSSGRTALQAQESRRQPRPPAEQSPHTMPVPEPSHGSPGTCAVCVSPGSNIHACLLPWQPKPGALQPCQAHTACSSASTQGCAPSLREALRGKSWGRPRCPELADVEPQGVRSKGWAACWLVRRNCTETSISKAHSLLVA